MLPHQILICRLSAVDSPYGSFIIVGLIIFDGLEESPTLKNYVYEKGNWLAHRPLSLG